MAAETLVALAVVAVLAFVAGWLARGRADGAQHDADPSPSVPPGEAAPAEPLFAKEPRPVSAPDPAAATLRLLDRAIAAYEAAVERWLDEGAQITPAGRAALGEFERAIKRVDVAASRIAEGTEARFSALDALDALREAATLLQPYRDGATLDAMRSRDLDRVEDEIGRARDGLAT